MLACAESEEDSVDLIIQIVARPNIQADLAHSRAGLNRGVVRRWMLRTSPPSLSTGEGRNPRQPSNTPEVGRHRDPSSPPSSRHNIFLLKDSNSLARIKPSFLAHREYQRSIHGHIGPRTSLLRRSETRVYLLPGPNAGPETEAVKETSANMAPEDCFFQTLSAWRREHRKVPILA